MSIYEDLGQSKGKKIKFTRCSRFVTSKLVVVGTSAGYYVEEQIPELLAWGRIIIAVKC